MNDISQPAPVPSQGASQTPRNWSRIARRIRIPLGFVFAVVYIWVSRPTPFSILLGTLVVLPGLALRGLASGHVQKDKELTTSGPYACTRNPLYLGSIMMAAGFALAARSWWIVVIMTLMFAIIYVPVIAGEEAYLRATFADYDEYARNVPRMFPRFTRFGAKQGAFSSARYWKHREYEASLGSAAMLGVLVAKLLLKRLW